MCGIALILSGVRLIGEALFQESCRARPSDSDEVYEPVLSVDELKVSLQRRGPDNLGSRRIFLQRKPTISVEDHADNNEEVCRVLGYHEKNHLISAHETVGAQNGGAVGVTPIVDLRFLGAMLQLRGKTPISQPLVDASGNLLVYNGEIFGGIHVAGDSNDAEILLHALERCYACECYGPQKCCSCQKKGEKSIPEVLSTIKGPWAVIYWQERSKTIWFGRDAFGRRSLLVHWPTRYDSQFILSSVSPLSSVRKDSGNESIKHLISSCIPGPVSQDKCLEDEADSDVADTGCNLKNWEELPCGIYSICLKRSKPSAHSQDENFYGEVEKHEWTDAWLSELIKWERSLLDPKAEKVSSYNIPFMSDKYARPLCSSEGMLHNVGDIGAQMEKQPHSMADITSSSNIIHAQAGYAQPACKVLTALREAVMCRTVLSTIYQTSQKGDGEKDPAPVAVLFSGGLDSMILAALLDQCLDSRYTIDLLNVSFDGQHAPDRISAKAGVRELGRIAHTRRWRLVEIDANLSDLNWETRHVVSLIHPARTYMDLNIGLALWLAAGGDGWVDRGDGHCRYKYKSTAKILLVGSGADEQCAGYGRHRTKYRMGGWVSLQAEMRLDMQRIWKRNLGRDDRCFSDHGKEARFPFLDEDVIRTLLEIPLWEIANLDEPVGRGDKKILREVAKLLGLETAAVMPKRAIQFGSRIARESNRKNFGSNRAANQASAGSVEIQASSL